MVDTIPTDNRFIDNLRIQRDDWIEVLEYLNEFANENNPEALERAKKKAGTVLNRIRESLQD